MQPEIKHINFDSDYADCYFPISYTIETNESETKNEETLTILEAKTDRVFKVVLDIDDVLALLTTIPCIDVKLSWKQVAAFFMRKGAILKAGNTTHYIYPGIIEFTKLLAKTNDILLSIFSSGWKWRNEPFTEALLIKAIGEKEYQAKKDQIRVFSVPDLVRQKKELSHVLKDITDSVLIDNDASNRARDYDNKLIEEKHFLYAPATITKDFLRLEFKEDKYDENGERDLKCILNASFRDYDKRKKHIVAEYWIAPNRVTNWADYDKMEKNWEINFWHEEEREYKKITLLKENEPELYKLLEPLKTSTAHTGLATNAPVTAALLQFVKKNGGQTKRICYKVNRIYLITAVLFRAIESARTTNTPLEDNLPRIELEYQKCSPRMPEWAYEYKLYREGLKRLRGINPELTFITPKNYMAAATTPISVEEDCFLVDAIKCENKGGI